MRKFYLKPSIIVTVIFAFVLAACGKERAQNSAPQMTESQAFHQLSNLPMSSSSHSSNSGSSAAQSQPSVEGLGQLIQDLVKSGKVKLPDSARHAVTSTGTLDLSWLTNFLNLITSGQATNAFSLASALLSGASGSGTKVSFNLNWILQLLQAAAPIIMAIAPQYAVIIQAIVSIIPMVQSIINMFFPPSPSPSPTAWLTHEGVVSA